MIKFTSEDKFIVTGASSGLGQGVALLLNKLGATVIGVARNRERLQETRNKCEHPENFFTEELDVTADIDGLPAWVKSMREKYGKFRGMAICHGIVHITPMQMVDYSSLQEIFNCDYFAPMMLAKGFVDRRNNIGRGAALVAISSIAAQLSERGMLEYSGAKAALTASMRSLAREVAPFGIRINTVSPSDIKTPMVFCGLSSINETKEKRYPLGFGEVEDVANMVVYLLSEDAKWIASQNYIIDCGVV